MQTISKVIFYTVLVCWALSWASGAGRPLSRVSSHPQSGRECRRVQARLRRCRSDNPSPHPVRPCKNAVLPPDDDNVDQDPTQAKSSHDCSASLCHEALLWPPFLTFGSRPLPTEVPLYQTFCILLI